jgi:hypothetical protein
MGDEQKDIITRSSPDRFPFLPDSEGLIDKHGKM